MTERRNWMVNCNNSGQLGDSSLYTEPIVSECIHFGIVGLYDFGFSRYIFAITKRENVCSNSDLNVGIYKILKVTAFNVYQQPLSLSLDEVIWLNVSKSIKLLRYVTWYLNSPLGTRTIRWMLI